MKLIWFILCIASVVHCSTFTRLQNNVKLFRDRKLNLQSHGTVMQIDTFVFGQGTHFDASMHKCCMTPREGAKMFIENVLDASVMRVNGTQTLPAGTLFVITCN